MKKLIFPLVILAGALYGATLNGWLDLPVLTSPARPSSGWARLFINTATGKLDCVDANGNSCAPAGSGGGGGETGTITVASPDFTVAGSPVSSGGTVTLSRNPARELFGTPGTHWSAETEEFYYPSAISATNTVFGKLSWTFRSTSSASLLPLAGSAQHPGLVQLATGTTSGASARLSLGSYSSGQSPFSRLDNVTGWEFQSIVQIATASTGSTPAASQVARLCLQDISAGEDCVRSSFAAEFDPALSPNWQYTICTAAGTCAPRVDSGVAVQTGRYYRVRFRSTTPGAWLASISDNGASFSTEKTGCSGCTINQALPATGLGYLVYMATSTAADRRMIVDFYGHYTPVAR